MWVSRVSTKSANLRCINSREVGNEQKQKQNSCEKSGISTLSLFG